MSKPLIEIHNLSKMYRLFQHPRHRIMDLLGLPAPKHAYHEFWALRDIDLTIATGQRLGIIGRNGAGKSTLLKIIAGLLQPTTGKVIVRGQVQALMELGTGFHPEFTGQQNIFAALSYQGITGKEAQRRFEEIVEFAELEEFIDNPLRTYSNGMQARLAFSVATAIKPEILIIDEVLGAGDAYFANKSSERMQQVVNSGASVLLVSHALDQVTRFCEEAIWIDRGRIVQRGPSLEVVKAYQQYIQVLEDRRLKAKNRKRRSGQYKPEQYDLYTDNLVTRFVLEGQAQARCDVTEIKLWENDQILDRLLVGDAQDTETSHSAFLVLDGSNWSEPQQMERNFYRSLVINNSNSAQVSGSAVFYLYSFFDNASYSIEVRYRCSGPVQPALEIWKSGVLHSRHSLPMGSSGWLTQRLPLELAKAESASPLVNLVQDGQVTKSISTLTELEPVVESVQEAEVQAVPPARSPRSISKWPGEGSLTIEDVQLLGIDDQEQTVFQVGTPMSLRMTIMAHKSGRFQIIPVAVIYRIDGIVVSQHWGEKTELELKSGEKRQARIDFGLLNLGNGNYIFSLGLFRELDLYILDKAEHYQIIDRSYEFQIFGNPPRMSALFRHPGEWRFL